MIVYYINREDREDRNYLFRGAMANMGFPVENLIRVIAKNREDYPTRELICDAAAADGFEGYFMRMRSREYPYYRTLVSAWSIMRAWRMIAEGTEVALQLLDDYYIKQPCVALHRLVMPLTDLRIVQMAWHTRDNVFFRDKFKLGIPYQYVRDEVSDKSPHFLKGAWQGASDWALVMSPEGASMLLDYMETRSPIDTECAITALQHTRPTLSGIYSLKNQPREVNGTVELRTNPWVGHLIRYTEGSESDLS